MEVDGNGRTTRYVYDANRRLTEVQFEDGTKYEYAYDSTNRLKRVLDAHGAAVTFDYDAAGRRTGVLRPNGVRTSYAYDAAGQVVDIVHDKAGEVLASFKYAYDGAGNRVSKEMADGVKEAYGYDGDGRLTSAAYGTARRVDYTLDAVGNRTVMEEAMGATLKSTRYTYNAFNQLLALNVAGSCGTGCPGAINTAFAYDGNGNLLSETTTVVGQAGSSTKRYAWDLDNRLRQVTTPDGAAHEYAYDAKEGGVSYAYDARAHRAADGGGRAGAAAGVPPRRPARLAQGCGR